MAQTDSPSAPHCILLRGVRQNNLKGFDLDLPLGQYIVVTGLSGAGKSSLVFDTLHAEGQRRYVETFSAYTRQFLDLLAQPRVDAIENIRPSIAIEQTNTVKTSRSTVGTMTELTDFFKVWFSHVAACFDPVTGEPVEDDSPQTVWTKTAAAHPGRTLLLGFKVTRPENLTWPEIFQNLKGQSYVRLLAARADIPAELTLHKIDDLLAATEADLRAAITGPVFVVQDRIAITPANRSRFLEAAETALHFGQGQVHLFGEAAPALRTPRFAELGHYSRGLHSPKTGRTFRAATPALFSFNSPLGACPRCRGFGRVIDIDYRLAVPDQSLSIADGAIKCWESDIYGESKKDLLKFTRQRKIPTDIPFASLTAEQQAFIIDGEPGYGEENGKTWPQYWYGVKGFFRWLEKNTYKMHVRVFLSRYRAYNPCPDCGGRRLQPEALCWQWRGKTLPELYQLPVNQLLALVAQAQLGRPDSKIPAAHSATLAHDSILTRLRYLEQVGLGYLTLDRSSKTLSGGEVQRVNLTSCLGTSLVDTLFVLDEPSVGLHPRDIDRLIGIIRSLTAAGNTVVVVEHDEAMIRAADHLIEVGPEPGHGGGQIVFQGNLAGMQADAASITGRYLSGRERIEPPAIAGVALATAGLALLSLNATMAVNFGDLLTLICAVAFAAHILLVGKYAPDFSPWTLGAGQILVAALASTLLALLTWPAGGLPPITSNVVLAVLISGLLGTAFAFTVQSAAQRFTTATHTALIFSLEPVAAGVSSYLLIGEVLTRRALLGCALARGKGVDRG
ncbi:MAG TPA: EamA family transporter, partial [Opitutaceae bacterium]|nr:EamA family transporter [Opitutaceae bacterium]